MLQQTFASQPFQYRLPGDIPITGFPFASYHPELVTPPRIYGEEYAGPGSPVVLFTYPEDIAGGYQVIWLGLGQNQVHWPGYNFVWYRFNASTGEFLGRLDTQYLLSDWSSIIGQSSDGTLYKLVTADNLVYQCTVDPLEGVTAASSPSFDLSTFAGVITTQAIDVEAAQNLLLAGVNSDGQLRVFNLTTGALVRTVALPAFVTQIMPIDDRQCYVMTAVGIICLIDYQAGTVNAAFAVQANGSTSPFESYRSITYDKLYRRFLSWNYTPVDGTGQNTSIVQGFYPVPVAVGITKPVPLIAPRQYRNVPILTRVYGDMGEAVGGGAVSLTVSNPTLGSIIGFPSLTDTDGESAGTLECLAAGAPTVLASVALASGIGTDGGEGPPPPPPPLPSNVRQPGDFPRLGGYLVSGSTDYDDPTRAGQIAKLDVAVLAFPPAWTGTTGLTMQQAILAIKAINPNITIVNYTDIVAAADVGAAEVVSAEVNAFYWWLYDHGAPPANPSAVKIASSEAGKTQINLTAYVPPNSFGQNYPAWRAQLDAVFTMEALALDGMYADKTTGIPTVNGDWDRDGDTAGGDPPDLTTDLTVGQWWRAGFNAYFTALRAAMPGGRYIFANSADWGEFYYSFVTQGGVIESIIGQATSPETTSFAVMMEDYGNILGLTSAPKLQIFAHDGSLTDYQDFRYGLCSCLMNDGYYYHSDGASVGGYHNVNWFDEFNFNLGAAQQTLGLVWQNGVLRRNFAWGIALVNPKGNGAQTVTLETNFQKLTGTQDPTTNNGATVSSVTLADRDGLILMRII